MEQLDQPNIFHRWIHDRLGEEALHSGTLDRFNNVLGAYLASDRALLKGLPRVDWVAQELCMSGAYLSDLLKQETGMSAQEHIHRHVVDKAKTKLLNSSLPVSQIAYDLGFEYPQHFSRLFKPKTGLTPVQFRKAN